MPILDAENKARELGGKLTFTRDGMHVSNPTMLAYAQFMEYLNEHNYMIVAQGFDNHVPWVLYSAPRVTLPTTEDR